MIKHQLQPTKKSCGQTCIAMLGDVSAHEVLAEIPEGRGTTAKQLRAYLEGVGWHTWWRPMRPGRELPAIAICRVRWGSSTWRSHWVLWAEGRFWDPLTTGMPLHVKNKNGRVVSFIELSPTAER